MGRSAGRVRKDDAAEKVVRFINNLTHTKGDYALKPFNMRRWQERIVRDLFRTGRGGIRQYRTCLMMLPRKNGKSELCAAIALYGLLGDGEIGAEVYIAAADRDQASLVFNVAAQMVRNDPELYQACEIIDSQKRIVHRASGSVLRAISADAHTKHGFNASMVIYDELHAAPNRELWDVLRTSQGARRQPLMIAITTAGYDRHSILWQVYDYACKVRDGLVDDDTFLPVIYEAPKDADWKDEKVWHAANPALGDYRDLGEMRRLAKEAAEMPGAENAFRRLYLNQWTEQAERWIDMAAWDACKGSLGWKELRERYRSKPCHAALDLSSRTDLTALALVFDEGDAKVVLPFFWVPEEGAEKRSRTDRVPYSQWIREGMIIPTPGNTVDQGFIRRDLNALAKEYRIQMLGFDPWNASKLCQELQDEDGFKVAEIRQGFRSLSEATKDLGALVTSKRLMHGGHPVLRWMASNMVVRQDPNGNLAPDKSKVTERIDGILALIMGITFKEVPEPKYEVFIVGRRR